MFVGDIVDSFVSGKKGVNLVQNDDALYFDVEKYEILFDVLIVPTLCISVPNEADDAVYLPCEQLIEYYPLAQC